MECLTQNNVWNEWNRTFHIISFQKLKIQLQPKYFKNHRIQIWL